MNLPDILLQHVVSIEAFEGTDGYGEDHYAAPVTVACFVDQKTRLVRDPAQAGSEVVSESTVYAQLDTVAPARSKVTFTDGAQTIVIDALRRDGGDLPVPSHLEIVCK